MIHFKFSDKDPRYLFLKYDNDIDYKCLKLTQTQVNLVDPICYLPTYSGPPFTQDVLWDYTKPNGETVFYAAIGMWQTLYNYFKSQHWEFDGLDPKHFKTNLPHTLEQFKEIVDSWNLKYKPRPYQYEAAYKVLQWKRSISELCTRSGKTLIAYMIFRYSMEYLNVKRVLMIVPSIELVKQAYEDFQEYAEFFHTECIWGGGKLVESANLTVGTFQSLIKYLDKRDKKYNPSFFNGYDVVFVDETHKATANQIRTIISQPFMLDVKLAFGLTGTVPEDHTIPRYLLHSLLGAKIQEIRSKNLMDDGYLSPVKIYQCRLHYNNKEKQLKHWLECAEYCLGDDVVYRETKTPIYPEQPKMVAYPKRNNTETDEEYTVRCNIVDERNRKKLADWENKCKIISDKGDVVITRKTLLENPKFLLQYQKTFPDGLQLAKDRAYAENTVESLLNYKKLLEKSIVLDVGANMLHVEVMMNHFFDERIEYLINILKKCKNNTLVLAQHREYIKYVYEKVKAAFPDRPVLYVIGGSKDQKIFKETLKGCDNAILIAGYSIMGTGVTLSNLAYEVLFESYKSEILVRQSLGRTLAKAKPAGVNQATIYDITDCYDRKYASSKILSQGNERIKIYNEQEFDNEIIDVYL